MAFYGKPVRSQVAESSGEDAASSAKIKQDLSRFEQSIRDMQSCLKSLNETIVGVYGEKLPRSNEFQRAIQDENTLLDNFARDVHEVEEPLRRYEQQYDGNLSGISAVASANRKSEFVSSVLGTLFTGQNVFFSESFKVTQVLLDIVTQAKHQPTPREAKLAKELAEEISDKTGVRRPSSRPTQAKADAIGGVSPFGGVVGHRGPGSLIGGAYGSQQPQRGSMAVQIKPASRFSSLQSTKAPQARIYV